MEIKQQKQESLQKAKPSSLSHKLELDNHRTLSVSGVLSVPIFTDKTVTINLDDETLIVGGHDLVIKTLDTENGKLILTGYVNMLKYTQKTSPASFIKKILK